MSLDADLLVRAGALLDEMQDARYHGSGAGAKLANDRWRRVAKLADDIDEYLGPLSCSKWRRRWEAREEMQRQRLAAAAGGGVTSMQFSTASCPVPGCDIAGQHGHETSSGGER